MGLEGRKGHLNFDNIRQKSYRILNGCFGWSVKSSL